jgi:aminopeptidase N
MMPLTAGAVILAVIATPLAAAAPAEAPFSFDAAPGRLPKNVVPISYTLSLVPNAAALTLRGSESVQLQFRSSDTATVQFNSLNETLQDVRLDGKPVQRVVTSDEQQLTTVTLAAPAPAGLHTLTFSYRGKIETQPHGLFAQHYAGNGGTPGLLLSTQLEATDARRMFPCWDEPAFRATYQLTVVIPANWTAVSNMPIEKRAVRR